MKLKQRFHQLFDTTPFSYLHKYRMKLALQTLRERTINIAEVANAFLRSHFSVGMVLLQVRVKEIIDKGMGNSS